MGNFLYIVLLSLAISGCTTFKTQFEIPQTSIITWKKVDDVDSYCRQHMNEELLPYPLIKVKGCAFYNKDKTRCVIFTGKNTSMSTLGHEVRHCFEDNWHD